MKARSAKNKGKRLQYKIRDLILEKFDTLESDDVRSITMGDSGEDILLSPAARKLFPFSVECKNQERINLWASWEQANSNKGIYAPLLVVKRNGQQPLVVLEADTFLEMVKEVEWK